MILIIVNSRTFQFHHMYVSYLGSQSAANQSCETAIKTIMKTLQKKKEKN